MWNQITTGLAIGLTIGLVMIAKVLLDEMGRPREGRSKNRRNRKTSFAEEREPDYRNEGTYAAKRVMSNRETEFFEVLKLAASDGQILCQVGLSRFIETSDRPTFGTISQKSIDFLICDHEGFPVIAIELDDRSHARWDRQQADQTKNAALESAGIPLLRVKSIPTPQKLRGMLEETTRRHYG